MVDAGVALAEEVAVEEGVSVVEGAALEAAALEG